MSEVGRPTAFKPEFPKIAYKLTLLGAIDKDLADAFDVSTQTINSWKHEFPEFLESIKNGKENADAFVAESLFKRATGYSHEDVDIRAVALGNNQGSEIVKTTIIKHYPPDTVAAIFWLKNRRPKNWREKLEVLHDDPSAERFIDLIARRMLSAGDVSQLEQKPPQSKCE